MIYGNSLHPNMIKTTKQFCTALVHTAKHSYSKE